MSHMQYLLPPSASCTRCTHACPCTPAGVAEPAAVGGVCEVRAADGAGLVPGAAAAAKRQATGRAPEGAESAPFPGQVRGAPARAGDHRPRHPGGP
eukprot:583987-Prorocentrum_minimum.AAC.4